MMDFCSYWLMKSSNRHFIPFVMLYGTYKPSTRLVVLSTDPEMAIKSLAMGNFEHFWYILTKNKYLWLSDLPIRSLCDSL